MVDVEGKKRGGLKNLYANVALDSLPAREGGNSRQPTLPSRENFAATSVAVCQFPRAIARAGGR